MRYSNRTRGFTVLEILVVIAIIAFLFAMTVGIAAAVRRHAQITATKALLQDISIAVTRYKAELAEFPPDSGYGLPRTSGNAGVTYDPGSLWRHLSRQVIDARTGKSYGPYLSFRNENVVQYNDPVHGASYCVIDVWGNPIGFTADRRRVSYNLGAFDLFSPGPDKVTASDDGINNGKFFNVPNTAYDGVGSDDASELGESILNGTLADDLNNWSTH